MLFRTNVVPDAEPKVVDTLCDYHELKKVVFGVYDDGSVVLSEMNTETSFSVEIEPIAPHPKRTCL